MLECSRVIDYALSQLDAYPQSSDYCGKIGHLINGLTAAAAMTKARPAATVSRTLEKFMASSTKKHVLRGNLAPGLGLLCLDHSATGGCKIRGGTFSLVAVRR